MKLRNLFYMMLLACPLAFASCSDDDDEPTLTPDIEKDDADPEDQLGVLKSALLTTDEDGNVTLLRGVKLDSADPTTVSISVDSYEEALVRFTELFSEETFKSADGTEFTLTDNAGKASIKKGDGENGLVAYADFDVPSIPEVTRINYILESAWPDNAKTTGKHKFGVRYSYKGWTGDHGYINDPEFNMNEWFNYVCVREYNGGEPALLIAITPKTYCLHWRNHGVYGGRIPSKSRALGISEILRKNWGAFRKYFNVDGNVLNDNERYWTDTGKDHGFWAWRHYVILSNGDSGKRDVHNTSPAYRVIFFIESKEQVTK